MIHIKELLKKRGITQAELANRLGINRIALNRTLSNPNIKLSTIEKIANAVGCNVSDFFCENNGNLICPYCGKKLEIEIK